MRGIVKKAVSMMLTAAIAAGAAPVFGAEEEEKRDEKGYVQEEDLGETGAATPIPIAEIEADEEGDGVIKMETEGAEEPLSFDPRKDNAIVHKETVDGKFNIPDMPESEEELPPDMYYPGEVGELSLDSDAEEVWNNMYASIYGDDYLAPYKVRKDGVTVSGNTNRLVAEYTDIGLPGKNGLDVEIKRKMDNQFYNVAYTSDRLYNANHEVYNTYYVYGYRNTSTNVLRRLRRYVQEHRRRYLYV